MSAATKKVRDTEHLPLHERLKRSLSRIRTLTLMQMGDKLRHGDKHQRRRKAFIIFLQVLAALCITAVLTVICYLIKSYFRLTLDYGLLSAMFLLTQVVSIVANVGTIQNVLFADKENGMLLTFPCRFEEIAISKLLLFFLRELKKNCFFLLPFLVGFGIATGSGAGFYLFSLLAYVLLSVTPIFVACVLSIAFLYGKRWLQSKPFLYVIFLAAVFSGLFYLAFRFLSILPNPLELIQKYSSYVGAIERTIDKVAALSLHYGCLADLMCGRGDIVDLIIVLTVSVAVIVIGIVILLPFYFRAVSSSAERSTKEKKVRKRYHADSSLAEAREKPSRFGLYKTFLHKELIITVRDVQKLSGTITSFFMLPLVSYVMNYILDTINTNPLGDYMTIAFNMMISASLLAAFNTDCACALSMEGLEFCVLKTAPSNTMSIAWAKITVTLLSNIIAVLATSIMLYFTTGISVLNLVLFTVTLILLAAGMVLWSFQLDVRRPQFMEYASKGSGVVDNPNIGKAALFGFIVATLGGALTLLLLYDDYATGWLRIIGIAAGFCAARAFLFYRNLQVYFHEIEL